MNKNKYIKNIDYDDDNIECIVIYEKHCKDEWHVKADTLMNVTMCHVLWMSQCVMYCGCSLCQVLLVIENKYTIYH